LARQPHLVRCQTFMPVPITEIMAESGKTMEPESAMINPPNV
jgi:hypothetical protein